jgi:hypothetical protein
VGDNVCSAEQIAPVREILPANCHLLFTTRDEKISRIIAGTNCLELKAFSSQLAIEFLRNQVDASESELMDTANRTKGIPDLLAVVAQQLDNDPLSKMHTWASNVSLEELERIPREKWNPLTPELYITRTKIERSLHDFLEASSTSNRGFCVLGDTGLGKTNLLCREYQRLHTNHHANSRDVLIFQSAKSLDERLGNNSLDVFLDNVILETLFSEQEVSISSDRTERISQALRWLGTLSNGRGIRFIIIVDAINELPEQDMFPFLMKLTRGIDALRNRNSDTNDSMYVSLIVSCRTFPWQTLWGGRELELNGYFGNLARDMDGEIKENLFEFDLSTEAREAYQKANIQPAWEELEDDFQYLCCNPFFLNIIKLIAHNRASVIQGTYFDVMNRYDEIVLRANRTGWESIQDANIRTAVLREMMLLLVDSEETPQTFGSEEASYNVLTRHLNERYHFQALEIEATLKGLLEDNVLEARGQKIRFAFDRYFDYRFSLHLNEKSKIERWQGPEWANLLDRFHRSSYHRNGVCMALTHKITYEQSPTSAVDFLKYLLEQDRAVAASYRELILNALKQYGEEEPTELTNILLILDTVVNDPFAITEVTCDVIASSRVRWSSKQYLMTVLQQVISRHLQNRRASENEAIRRNLINTIGGLGRTEQGPKLIIEVLRNLLGMDQQIGGLPEFLDVVFEAFLSNDFQTALTKIRVRTLRAFNEDITRVKLILLILRISITTPSMVIAVAKRIGLIRYSKLIARLLSQFDLFFEIVVKGVAMFVTERENLSDAEFRTHLSVVEILLSVRFFIQS